LVSDNRPQFVSHELQQLLSAHGVRHSKTASYNPQANGEVERFNRELKEGLKAAMADGKSFQQGRQNSMQYFLPSAGKNVHVCKHCFLDTLNVGTMFVRCALKDKTR